MSPPRLCLRTIACGRSAARFYHSYQHPPSSTPYNEAEAAILKASLARVPEHGFSSTALAYGARDAGYLDISINLFPQGAFDLVAYHLAAQRLLLSKTTNFAALEKEAGEQLGVGAKIRTLCINRLRGNTPYIHRWQEALALMSFAGNIPVSVSELAKLADEMWFLAGDTSADTSWYTKRGLLSAVYASTELYMSQDRSHDFSETWKFLDRRLADTQALGTVSSNLASYTHFNLHQAVNVLRSKNFPLL